MTKRARYLVAALAASSLLVAVPGAQAELRVGKNYRMNSDLNAFRGKDAVALAVNPGNPNHVVAVNNEYLAPSCEGTRSLDGGATWSEADDLPVPPAGTGQQAFSPACSRIGDHLAESMRQTVAFGSGQNVYAAYAARRLAGAGDQAQSVVVGKSTDGGRTWSTARVAMEGGPLTSPYYELPTIAVRPGTGGAPDRVYVAARETTATGLSADGDAAFAVSNDGGATFSPAPAAVEGSTENVADVSQPAIAPDGKVYLAWRTRGITGLIKIARSDNNGVTWNSPVAVAGVVNTASSSSNPPTPLASTGSSFPRIAVGPNGNVYIVYNQGADPPSAPAGGFQGTDHFIPPDTDVYFQRSLDAGQRWSEPKLINDATKRPGHESPYDPPSTGVVTQTRHPNIAVAPNGRVDIVWQDRRHWYRGCVHTHVFCQEARLGDTYYSSSSNGGGTFSPDHRISDRSHNNDVGYDYRFGTGWTFGPIVVPQGTNQLLVGWMDSRNGNYHSDTQDIYLAKVNLAAPAGVPQETLQRTDSIATSVRLSNHAYPGGGESMLVSNFATRNGTRVVIANENDYPSILAGGVLARANLSTVLLSPAAGLPASVKAELARLKPAGAYVLGDAGSLSNQVVEDLVAAGVADDGDPATDPRAQIQRIAGASDAEEAASIATTLDRRTDAEKTANSPPAFNAVTIVNPASPDASAAAGLAAARRLPILFVSTDSIPAATSNVISALDIDRTLVIGGPEWVSNTVLNRLPGSKRLGGANQYATSRAVVNESIDRGLPTNIAYVADGSRPIDGALLGPAVGRVTGLMALSGGPLSLTAAGTAAGMGLSSELDRMILLQPAAAAPQQPSPTAPTYGFPSAPFAGCPATTANVIRGTAAGNVITGTTAADRIFAGTGNDVVDALAGDDCVDLGTGNDRGQGGLGDDLLIAGRGNDRVSGSSGNDRLRGNSGNDRLDGGRGTDRVFGDAGNDTLLGHLGNDRLHGMSGRDRISGSRGRDRINGGSGNDRISAGSSGDRIAGDAGHDRINGNSGKDRISGNSGNDRITAVDNQRDRINCGSGRDRVVADREDVVSRNCERVRRR